MGMQAQFTLEQLPEAAKVRFIDAEGNNSEIAVIEIPGQNPESFCTDDHRLVCWFDVNDAPDSEAITGLIHWLIYNRIPFCCS